MKQTVLKVELRRTQYVLPPYAMAVLFCNILFSAGKNSFKQFIYDQLQLLGRFFFFLILRIMAQMAYCHPAYWTRWSERG